MNLGKPDTIYDFISYPSLSYKATHPDHLATVATVLGMAPPSVNRCRVLELGCAGGGNLMAMAMTLPDSQFVGLDLSSQQIARGQAVLAAVGLPNVHLEQMDIQDIIRHRAGKLPACQNHLTTSSLTGSYPGSLRPFRMYCWTYAKHC